MAARPPKPPDSISTRMVKLQSPAESSEDSYKCLQNEKSDCSCTNISIMQLFHEMKQVFPTVPDHVVNQCVIENCHDRENCVKNLNSELAAHPNTAQTYPSHVIRGVGGVGGGIACLNQQQIGGGNKKPLVPTRPAPAPKPNCDSKQFPKIPKTTTSTNVNQVQQEIGNKIASAITGNISDLRPPAINSDSKKPNVPQRPTTLNFRDPPSPQPTVRTPNQPRRAAPPPPPPGVKYQTPSPQPPPSSCIQNTNDQNHNFNATAASVQSPLSFSDSGESEISVNFSLSPSSSDRSRAGIHPTRRISSLSVHPEPPYTRDFTTATVSTPQSPRSFTSLNLTLRKPNGSPQPPIDITAGPGLTYSSSSFDAKLGYQQNFHITVTDGGGSFSTCRVRPRSCYNMTAQHLDAEFSSNPEQTNSLRTVISMPNVAQNLPPSEIIAAIDESRTEVNGEIIRRQQVRKSKLVNELRKNQKRLEEMDREINLLQSPIPPNESDRLDWEIQILRCDCEKLCHEIERAGAAGVSLENVYENIYNGQQAQQRPQRPPRQRPPLPPALSRLDPQHLSRPSPPSFTPIPNFQPSSYPLASSVPNQSYDDADYANGNFSDDNGPPWTCSMCTFQNNPLLNKCEECDNVRIIPGTVQIIPSSSTSQFDSLLSAVTPSSPLSNNNLINNNNNLHRNIMQRNPSNTSTDSNMINNNALLANNSRQISPLIAYPSIMNPISTPNANCVIPQ